MQVTITDTTIIIVAPVDMNLKEYQRELRRHGVPDDRCELAEIDSDGVNNVITLRRQSISTVRGTR